jgi:hypothetical protein
LCNLDRGADTSLLSARNHLQRVLAVVMETALLKPLPPPISWEEQQKQTRLDNTTRPITTSSSIRDRSATLQESSPIRSPLQTAPGNSDKSFDELHEIYTGVLTDLQDAHRRAKAMFGHNVDDSLVLQQYDQVLGLLEDSHVTFRVWTSEIIQDPSTFLNGLRHLTKLDAQLSSTLRHILLKLYSRLTHINHDIESYKRLPKWVLFCSLFSSSRITFQTARKSSMIFVFSAENCTNISMES